MSKPNVHCRCGHRVRSKEILRTDLYERASGRAYVFVKFRCGWCKRLGEDFIPEQDWDWLSLEPARDEMTEAERQQSAQRAAITSSEVLDFHQHLQQLDIQGIRQALGVPNRMTKKDGSKNIERSRSGQTTSIHPGSGNASGGEATGNAVGNDESGKKTRVARRARRRIRRERNSDSPPDDTASTS